MDFNQMIQRIKAHPDFSGMGMIATHLGVVRGHSLGGEEVSEIEVAFDHDKIESIVQEIKKLPGIVECVVHVSEGCLKVGDDIMALAIGGDTREHVFPALMEAVDRIKTDASNKKEKMV